ncbi:hypothetical protein ACJX0J_015495, partial [Zea mays]
HYWFLWQFTLKVNMILFYAPWTHMPGDSGLCPNEEEQLTPEGLPSGPSCFYVIAAVKCAVFDRQLEGNLVLVIFIHPFIATPFWGAQHGMLVLTIVCDLDPNLMLEDQHNNGWVGVGGGGGG